MLDSPSFNCLANITPVSLLQSRLTGVMFAGSGLNLIPGILH